MCFIKFIFLYLQNYLFADKPETITFQPPDSEYSVIKDAVIPNVTCSANCFPVCQYEWYKDNNPTPISTSSVLSLGAARINTAGLYSCRAVNSLDSIRKDFAVTVKCEYNLLIYN